MSNHGEIESLVTRLRSFRTRAQAREELRALGDAAVPELLGMVEDAQEPENARWAGITLLGDMKCEQAVPLLVSLLRDDLPLRGEAHRALVQISGQDAGEDADAWETSLANCPEDAEAVEAGGESVPSGEEGVSDLELCRRAVGDVATKLSWEGTDDEGYAYIRLPLKEGRKQQMIVTFDEMDDDERPLATIYTECGPATPEAVQAMSRWNVTLRYGTFVVEESAEGQQKVVMRHQTLKSGLLPESLRTILLTMAREADGLEFEITQSDQI
ncbi:MAG: HEAT repeat domain-containing protein [Lentisphaerae bacterium]|jgi:hypothetical protein|nr:HEAT repeat domain-containing protein [Lentisphaerota bacterium]MBT4816428.1 HEAT repeat domain-containing protein [Lentisphaerota bacterium]MBT5604586.1 HEAT repeat domain-containing protein [Lentisphaerota bacterium]MBT7061759.1 HEAT repeat domain-containing protein [Lentisphaerota bacterium]MBT7848783.1 HEAT repeat domain-containing protein [Lentisphaerota bacterium]